MRILKYSLDSILCIAIAASSQQPPALKDLPPYPETRVSNIPQPERVVLANNAVGLVDPVLIPGETPPLSKDCKGTKDAGSVTLSFVVDATGQPRNVMFKKALANQIDLLALQILLDSRFHPATLNGAPVAVGSDVEIHLQVCIEPKPGTTQELVRLRAPKTEKFMDWQHPPAEANLAPIHMPPDAIADAEKQGPGFSAPKSIALNMPDAKGMSGSFAFGVLVDEHGLGHIEKVLGATNQKLLPIAAEAIHNTRHTPALKDGMPVPTHRTEEVAVTSGN